MLSILRMGGGRLREAAPLGEVLLSASGDIDINTNAYSLDVTNNSGRIDIRDEDAVVINQLN